MSFSYGAWWRPSISRIPKNESSPDGLGRFRGIGFHLRTANVTERWHGRCRLSCCPDKEQRGINRDRHAALATSLQCTDYVLYVVPKGTRGLRSSQPQRSRR